MNMMASGFGVPGFKTLNANGHLIHYAEQGAGWRYDTLLEKEPETIEWMMDEIDLILVMSINPGFGGQTFMHSQLKKIERLRKMIDATGRDIPLEVDGGVTPQTAPLCIAAGATALVAGTAVFKGGPAAYADNIRALRGG